MSAGRKLNEALQQNRELTAAARVAYEKRLARAVDNVLDGTTTVRDAAKGFGVSAGSVAEAVKKARGG